MLGIPIGLLAANATEWVLHKYVLHGSGKKKGTFWSFHFHEHHKNVRHQDHIDPCYEKPVFGMHAQGKEALALAVGAVAHLPLLPIAPFYTATMWYSALNYYRKHKRSHQDTEWARDHLPWHYDHHMGPNQDANWCVTQPWFDHIMGTREPYIGTEREVRDRSKREAFMARKAQRAAERGAQAVDTQASDAASKANGRKSHANSVA